MSGSLGPHATDERVHHEKSAALRQLTGVRTSIPDVTDVVVRLRQNAPEPSVDLRRDLLTVADLRAWQRSWSLTDAEVAIVLQPRYGAESMLRILYSPPYRELSIWLSSRLRRYREKSKAQIMKLAAKRPLALRALDSSQQKKQDRRLIRMNLVPIGGDQYEMECYTHGLWPGELAYYRFLPKNERKNSGCLVVHVPTKVAAECSDYWKFVVNRQYAESRLIVALARHFRERALWSKQREVGRHGKQKKKASDDPPAPPRQRGHRPDGRFVWRPGDEPGG